ncbi:MAG: acyl-CoA dehydrogenase [Sandaracinaceae bacterium]|nr:acyl-CoA dehydrogenase [Sandaracinaceae bacterium]
MQIYRAPIEDMMFQLAAFGYEDVAGLSRFEAFDLETLRMILEQTGALASDVLLACNRAGDEDGVKWDPATGAVKTARGFREAHRALAENGYYGLTADEAHGGGGAPYTLGTLVREILMSANKSLAMAPGLTGGLIEALEAHAAPELQTMYLPKLAAGEWTGTMCLTEPHAGTDLGLLTTRATPNDDGTYALTGTKIWITFGEHDLADNIIHLVLARLPDAPQGVKGISTFLVPKVLPDGTRNAIACSGLEHKMGIHGSPTCVMDLTGATGWLVGQPHRGMASMFTMMNAARLFVGVEGISLGEIAYQTALEFAKDRRQSRALDPRRSDPSAAADNILVHPDVRRMLLNARSTTEAMRGLAVLVSTNIDLAHHHPDEDARQRAEDLVALLTPVVKSYCTERGFANVSDAMQVCGGAGYTRDWSIEQYLRDMRIALIYEGTNHIQALDLVGRKLPMHDGRLFRTFVKEARAAVAAGRAHESTAGFADALDEALGHLVGATEQLAERAGRDREELGAVASNYLHLFGLVACAYSWVRQVAHAVATDAPNRATKLKTARFFFALVLPELHGVLGKLGAGAAPMMDFELDEL